jgi:hypothetical protein
MIRLTTSQRHAIWPAWNRRGYRRAAVYVLPAVPLSPPDADPAELAGVDDERMPGKFPFAGSLCYPPLMVGAGAPLVVSVAGCG